MESPTRTRQVSRDTEWCTQARGMRKYIFKKLSALFALSLFRPYPCSVQPCQESFIDSKSLRRHREACHPTAVPDPELDVMDEEEEELIEPGQEHQYLPPAPPVQSSGKETSDDEGLPADESKNEDDDDAESNEGDLKIAETSADSGINESMDNSAEERTL